MTYTPGKCRYRVQSVHETLLIFSYKPPQVHFKCTVVDKNSARISLDYQVIKIDMSQAVLIFQISNVLSF